jgi:phosphoserine phosphatase
MASQDFSDRPSNKLVLFDVDGTLTPARQVYLIPLATFTVTHEH